MPDIILREEWEESLGETRARLEQRHVEQREAEREALLAGAERLADMVEDRVAALGTDRLDRVTALRDHAEALDAHDPAFPQQARTVASALTRAADDIGTALDLTPAKVQVDRTRSLSSRSALRRRAIRQGLQSSAATVPPSAVVIDHLLDYDAPKSRIQQRWDAMMLVGLAEILDTQENRVISATALDADADADTIETEDDRAVIISDRVRVTVTGGTPPYSFAWVSDSDSAHAVKPQRAITRFVFDGLEPDEESRVLFTCTVTDAAGDSAEVDVAAIFHRIDDDIEEVTVTLDRAEVKGAGQSDTVTTDAVTAEIAGADGTPAFAWVRLQGEGAPTDPASPTTAFELIGLEPGESATGLFECIVTVDGLELHSQPVAARFQDIRTAPIDDTEALAIVSSHDTVLHVAPEQDSRTEVFILTPADNGLIDDPVWELDEGLVVSQTPGTNAFFFRIDRDLAPGTELDASLHVARADGRSGDIDFTIVVDDGVLDDDEDEEDDDEEDVIVDPIDPDPLDEDDEEEDDDEEDVIVVPVEGGEEDEHDPPPAPSPSPVIDATIEELIRDTEIGEDRMRRVSFISAARAAGIVTAVDLLRVADERRRTAPFKSRATVIGEALGETVSARDAARLPSERMINALINKAKRHG